MSERGTFISEFVYCKHCLDSVALAICGHEFIDSSISQNANGLGFISGRISGMAPGSELLTFELDIIPKIEGEICKPVRIAVLAESCSKIYNIQPVDLG